MASDNEYISKSDYNGYYAFAKKKHDALNNEESKKELEKAEKLLKNYKKIQEYQKIDRNDYYKILNVSRDSTPEEISNAYKRLAMQFHPDKTKIKESNEQFTKIKNAYEILKDEDKKERYDSERMYNPHNYTFAATEYTDILNEYFRRREGEASSSFFQDPFITHFYTNSHIFYSNLQSGPFRPRRQHDETRIFYLFHFIIIIIFLFLFY